MQIATKSELKSVSLLSRRSERNETKQFLIEGEKLIQEAIAAEWTIVSLYVTKRYASQKSVPKDVPVYQVDEDDMQRLSQVETAPGIMAIVAIKAAMPDFSTAKRIALFADISDPGNMGTMLRTADWFGLEAIVTTAQGVDPYNDKAVRASMGSLFHVPTYTSPDLASALTLIKKHGFHIIGTDVHGSSSLQSDEQKTCIVMGNESRGLDDSAKPYIDSWYTIPSFGKAESLNVSVSFGIILSQLSSHNHE